MVIDDRGKLLPETDEVERRELTLEDGKLQVIAPSTHRLEDQAQALRVGDVVRDDVGVAHG